MPSFSSSSSRMMIRGVTISIRLVVMRPIPMLRNRRSSSGVLERIGNAVLRPLLVQRLDAAEQDGAAVGDRHRRRDRGGGVGELDRGVDRSPTRHPDRCRRRPPGPRIVVKPVERR